MNALKYVLVGGACIVGTTALWSILRPKMDCPTCKCNCPQGIPGSPGKAGMNCQLFDNNGRLACKYDDNTTMTSNIPTQGALGNIPCEGRTTYSTVHLWLMVVFVLLWLILLYRMINVSEFQKKYNAIDRRLYTIQEEATRQLSRSRA